VVQNHCVYKRPASVGDLMVESAVWLGRYGA